ncbi:hypothetical protein EDD21DRAFT_224211 [Dissophora ornata]|nr:hypothetical protein EDD21DRAFT_224211 [Dissophora ornata]
METTQHVEKTRHLLKMLELNSKAPLIDVLNAASSRIECELFMANHTKDAEGKKAQAEGAARSLSPDLTATMFPKVVQVNNDMLGEFACNKMRREMDWSFAYDFNPSDCNKTTWKVDNRTKRWGSFIAHLLIYMRLGLWLKSSYLHALRHQYSALTTRRSCKSTAQAPTA